MGILASDWLESLNEKVRGKKGGKGETAQGSGTFLEGLDEGLQLAEDFIKMKLK